MSTTYSESAKHDIIKSFLEGHKEYRDIIYSFRGNPAGTFLFDPVENEQIFDFFMEAPEVFPAMVKAAVVMMMEGSDVKEEVKKHLKVKISNARQIKFNEWTSKYEAVPVMVECQVRGAYKEETYTKSAEAICADGHRYRVRNLSHPPKCQTENCEHPDAVEIDPSSVQTGDIRTVIIQAPMEEARFGTIRTLECIIKDDDVANTSIGQRVAVVGVFKSHPQKQKSTNRILIHAISVRRLAERQAREPTPEQIKSFQQMASKDDYFDLLTSSWAPEIMGEDLAKLCAILTRIKTKKMDRIRSEAHTLLIGNPGTGKTRILEFLPLVTEKCGFAVGGTATGSGVTVTMDRLPNGQKFPQAGIVPMCSGSCVALDELNQFEPEDLGKLYEGMESGRIHYNKGGHDLDLEAETAVLAGANPRGYTYDFSFGMVDNIHLPQPLISRFDLIVNMTGSKTITVEQQKITHMGLIRTIGIDEYIRQNKLLTPDEMMVLLNHASSMDIKMTKEADLVLQKFHLTMFNLQESQKQQEGAKRIDSRFLDALYRISTKIAQLRLSDKVTARHAQEAIELQKRILQTFNLKTDEEMQQMSMSEAGKDRMTAFDFTWRTIEQETKSEWVDAREFLSRLVTDHPQLWTKTTADKEFRKRHNSGDLQFKEGMYKML